MGLRRQARETALQVLYGLEFEHASPGEARERFWESQDTPEDVREFADLLVTGVLGNREDIDQVIESASTNWRISRMAIVDRNILRIATYEICYQEEIPEKVSLNEAIEVGKRYGAEDSGAFINGILDRIRLVVEAG